MNTPQKKTYTRVRGKFQTAGLTPGTLPSASLRVDCTRESEFKQVSISLTGEKPWELTYRFNGKEVTIPDIQNPLLKLDIGKRGSFYLKSVQDRYGNKIEYEISPNSRKFVNPCFIVSNPMMPSRDQSQ